MSALPQPRFSPADYLAWEADQPVKHEYVRGEVFAMAGASDAHVTVSGNVYAVLRDHLRGTGCRTYIADMKLKAADNAYFYPDVFVTCSAADAKRSDIKEEAVLVVEVLSPSTAAYDRGVKFAYYRGMTSLQEYVLIDPERVSVDVFRRGADGLWVLHPFGPGDTVELASIGLRLPMQRVYEDITDAEGVPLVMASSGG